MIFTSPVNAFGSGKMRVPSVPVISTTPIFASGDWKLNTLWLTPPPANCAMADTWVGRQPGTRFQPISDLDGAGGAILDPAATVATGPKMWTSVVMWYGPMSNSRPARKEELGLGWKMSGPGYCMTVCADMGADVAVGDRATRGLHPLAEHGVWCDAYQPFARDSACSRRHVRSLGRH